MTAYLDTTTFKTLTVMPSSDVDALEVVASGYLAAQLDHWSRWIDAQLRKRYECPFVAPYPETVKLWLARLVTVPMFLRRGVDPNDLQFAEIKESADSARVEIKEAADAEDGLYDLPLRADTTATGISKGGPLSYSEQSPYVWTDQQGDTGHTEDVARRGTGG